MNYCKASNLNNQAFLSKNNIPWYFVNPEPDKRYILGQILAFSDSTTRILNTIITLCKRYKLVYASQKTIARISKVHITTANKALAYLEDLGLIAIKNNGANKPCWYKASSYFNNIFVMESLSKKLAIFYYSIRSLLSRSSADALRCIKDLRNIYIFKTLPVIRVTTVEEGGNEVLAKISDRLRLDEFETTQLSSYDNKVLEESYKILQNTRNVKNQYRFLLGICKKLQEKENEQKHTKIKRNTSNDKTFMLTKSNISNSKFEVPEKTAEEDQCLIMYTRSECQPVNKTISEKKEVFKNQYDGISSSSLGDIESQISNLRDEALIIYRMPIGAQKTKMINENAKKMQSLEKQALLIRQKKF